MSAKEASLSFLTSIEFGNKSANDITTPQKSNGSHELRKSNSTSKKARLRHSDNGRKQLIKYNEEKKSATDFLKSISLGEERDDEKEIQHITSSSNHIVKPENKSNQKAEIKKLCSNKDDFRGYVGLALFIALSNADNTQRYLYNIKNGSFLSSSLICLESNKKNIIKNQDVEKQKQGISYGYIFSAQSNTNYDPYYLDNDSTKPEKLKTVINLPNYCITIIPFFDDKEAKEEENEAFVDRHSWLDTDLTLSSIRSAKRKLYEISVEESIDLVCVAVAYVYLEKLILKNYVTKSNLKCITSICLLLAVKFYGQRTHNYLPLLKEMEDKFDSTPKEILQNEFKAYKTLGFSLLTHTHEYLPHLLKLQREYQS